MAIGDRNKAVSRETLDVARPEYSQIPIGSTVAQVGSAKPAIKPVSERKHLTEGCLLLQAVGYTMTSDFRGPFRRS